MIKSLDTDKPKTLTQLLKDQGKLCTICNQPITHMQGYGQSLLCREHQLKSNKYNNGLGRLDRLYTFHRKHYCENCGYNPYEDSKYDKYKTDLKLFNRLCRNQLVGDHQQRRSDGGSDCAENIKTYCLRCNADKTILSEDYKKGSQNLV